MDKVIYKIPVPVNQYIEVYEFDECWEWRLVENGKVLEDTKNMQYGSPEYALKDAINKYII